MMISASPSTSLSFVDMPQDCYSAEETIRRRYSRVKDWETPLPKALDPRRKNVHIQLTMESRNAHYKGQSKNNKDAACVLADNPIPPMCGIYYFEVEIKDKGRDGFIGIGVCFDSCSTNKLPGWEEKSWGYHADDGHKFSSNGQGTPYGPTFTTGDVIGCCINFVTRTCFYTKNGIMLGQAFKDLPTTGLYPVVGMQTPGEMVEVNFGQKPFCFDIDDYLLEWQRRTAATISNFTLPPLYHKSVQKLVASYLVHYGYSETARLFAKDTEQSIDEELESIAKRQKIQSLVLNGQMDEAIAETQQQYPGLLESNPRLHFQLKCRQFVELAGRPPFAGDTSAQASSERELNAGTNGCSVDDGDDATTPTRGSDALVTLPSPGHLAASTPPPASPSASAQPSQSPSSALRARPHLRSAARCRSDSGSPSLPSAHQRSPAAGASSHTRSSHGSVSPLNVPASASDTPQASTEVPMAVDGAFDTAADSTSTLSAHNGSAVNGDCLASKPAVIRSAADPDLVIMDTDSESGSDTEDADCNPGIYTEAYKEKMNNLLRLGQTISEMYRQMGEKAEDVKLMEEAFSLICYPNPRKSPVKHLLDSERRDDVCLQLNAAILQRHNLPRRPPLELLLAHSAELLELMAQKGLGSSAFAHISDYVTLSVG